MANNAKVMLSIKDFLLKMKALDEAIPEELAEDACEMVENVKDALEEELVEDEDNKLGEEEEKVEVEAKDEEAVTKEYVNKTVEDSMVRVLRKYGLIKDAAMISLDELEEELTEDGCKEDAEDEMNEEAVTVDPEKMNDSLRREILKKVKPVIASVKDSRQRKALADSFAEALSIPTSHSTQYSDVLNIAKANAKDMAINSKNATSDYDFGMEVAKRFNPHYKEEQ